MAYEKEHENWDITDKIKFINFYFALRKRVVSGKDKSNNDDYYDV